MAITQADFYLIQATDAEARLRFACRLTQTVVNQSRRVYLHTEDLAQAQLLDELLWSFKPESFIPHLVGSESATDDVLVYLGFGVASALTRDKAVLINLATRLPQDYLEFERLAAVASNETIQLQQLRAHYKILQTQGISIQTHDMRKSPA